MGETNEGLENLIGIINRLQGIFAGLGEDLVLQFPRLAVVGDQSAGKSSVLEKFVGRDFLPCGTGIVTRRPLILQLIQSEQEYAEFGHLRGNIFTDFDEIRREIEQETNRKLGNTKMISPVPIRLRIHSPHVLDLTLVDLPGMTRVQIRDQPNNIEHQIRSLILSYIEHENCIILAVLPANQDLATSEALKLAREVDPDGSRTIGVLTKLDIMDQGTDAREILENRLFRLRRGFVGVIGRSQRDIEAGVDIRASLEKEREFFESHPAYRNLADKCGTQYLQRMLNRQFVDHIRQTLPGLRRRMQLKLQDLELEMKANEPHENRRIMARAVQQVSRDFKRNFESDRNSVDLKEISDGVKIKEVFHELILIELLRETPNEDEMRREISIAFQNARGVRSRLLSPSMIIESVTKNYITRLREPTLNHADLIIQKVNAVLEKCISPLSRWPPLLYEAERLVDSHLKESGEKLRDQLLTFVDMQVAYINLSQAEQDDIFDLSSLKLDTDSNKLSSESLQTKKGWFSTLTRHQPTLAPQTDIEAATFEKHVDLAINVIKCYIERVAKTHRDLIMGSTMKFLIDPMMKLLDVGLLDLFIHLQETLMRDVKDCSSVEETYRRYQTALSILDELEDPFGPLN